MRRTDLPIDCRPHIRTIARQVDLEALARSVAQNDQPAILGGNPSVRGVSLFTAEPVETLEVSLDELKPFDRLSAFLSRYRLKPGPSVAADTGFFGGWIGYFGYELGRFIEQLPCRAEDDIGLPVIRLAFYDKAILFDHARNEFRFVVLDTDDGRCLQTKWDTLNDWFEHAESQSVEGTETAAIEMTHWPEPHGTMSRDDYFTALQKIHRHIVDGDVYQINFSRRLSIPFAGCPADLFCWQNRHNPSPYAAYLAWDRSAVVSASPELFLQVCGDRVITCPIKGTRPRNPALPEDDPFNQAQFEALVQSRKDQAELAMIVDLERNDLARVCVPGTRYVSCARRIEAFPTVYHAVATVEGTLSLPPDPARIEGLLRATFPGGSITGAPKIRAMEIIDALEPTARGVYTGSIGWIGLNFDTCLNIVIRTILIHNELAHVQTGGGIVADSDPQAEWDETLTKARALLAGLHSLGSRC